MSFARCLSLWVFFIWMLGSGVASSQEVALDLERALEAQLEANRELEIREIVERWAAPERSSEQLQAALGRAKTRKLLQISRAESYDEVNRILGGEPTRATDDWTNPGSLGDTNRDFVFTPVTPCRLFDTRLAGGVIAAGGAREFYVYGAGDVSGQGGNPAGCTSPRGEPRAIHLNLAVIPQGVQGNARVYPADVATPTAAFINFQPAVVTSNAGTVKTQFALGPREIEVFVSAAAHVVGDVMGYYYDVDDLSTYHTSSSLNNGSPNPTTTFIKLNDFLTFTKASNSSKIEVHLHSRAYSGIFSGASGVTFQVRLDNQPPDYGNDATITVSNTTQFISIFAVFEGFAAGSHTVSVWARTNAGSSTDVLLDPGGWGGRFVAKETF